MTYSSPAFHQHPCVEAVRRQLHRTGKSNLRVLSGVSGGVDSMVMLTILHGLGFEVHAGHVNYQLRGEDSDLDHQLVKSWCTHNKIPFYDLVVDTKVEMEKSGEGLQVTARNIRLQFWQNLIKEHQLDVIAKAHHHDDNVETFFINALRGTGIAGLKGISHTSHFSSVKIIHPMLECTRSMIEEFATSFQIPFRHDRSNQDDHYLRNKIRHHLLPAIKTIDDHQKAPLQHTLERMRLEADAFLYAYDAWQKENVVVENDEVIISANSHTQGFVLKYLEHSGIPWSLAHDFIGADDTSSKVLEYEDYQLFKIKDGFRLTTKSAFKPLEISGPGRYVLEGKNYLSIQPCKKDSIQFSENKNVEFIPASRVNWPLEVRRINPGDHFQPLGMNGQSKKLQDFLTDLKMDMYEKSKVRLLCNDNQIIWVIAYRLDERFRIESEDADILKLELES